MTNNKFDKIAKTLRKNRNLSIKQLAELLELTPGNIQNLENGKKIATDDIIDKYMEVFNQKEEQSFILSSSSDKYIDDYITIDFDNANNNHGLKLISLYPIIDPKIILDTFSTCEYYGYNFDPSIISASCLMERFLFFLNVIAILSNLLLFIDFSPEYQTIY